MTKAEKTETRLALYRKYRPTKLDEVIGQPQVTDILAAMARTGNFAHAFLFTGQRGTGKTTVARILAHLINGLDYNDNINSSDIDIIEIDAASNNSVDDIRNLRDSINLAPMKSKYKVYIIDEFHMLSKAAFNALLKTIEEPPEHAIFILATTELQKVPATILSRVQRYHFRPLAPELLAKHLRTIADKEHIDIDDQALLLVAKCGGGSVRDSITILDQLSSSNSTITKSTVEEVLGMISSEQIGGLVQKIADHDSKGIITDIQNMLADGASAQSLVNQIVSFLAEASINAPELYVIINRLLDAPKSAMPEQKLIAVLVEASLKGQGSKTATVELPAIKVVQPAASKKAEPLEPIKPAQATQATQSARATQQDTLTNTVKAHAQAAMKTSAAATAQKVNKIVSPVAAPSDFDGEIKHDDVKAKLTDMDELSACSLVEFAEMRYSKQSNELTLFFSKAFHRKKADTANFRDTLTAAIESLYNFRPSIIISKNAAPADSDASKVMELMGGGEVVKNAEI